MNFCRAIYTACISHKFKVHREGCKFPLCYLTGTCKQVCCYPPCSKTLQTQYSSWQQCRKAPIIASLRQLFEYAHFLLSDPKKTVLEGMLVYIQNIACRTSLLLSQCYKHFEVQTYSLQVHFVCQNTVSEYATESFPKTGFRLVISALYCQSYFAVCFSRFAESMQQAGQSCPPNLLGQPIWQKLHHEVCSIVPKSSRQIE